MRIGSTLFFVLLLLLFLGEGGYRYDLRIAICLRKPIALSNGFQQRRRRSVDWFNEIQIHVITVFNPLLSEHVE
jgi:hypothetical protein